MTERNENSIQSPPIVQHDECSTDNQEDNDNNNPIETMENRWSDPRKDSVHTMKDDDKKNSNGSNRIVSRQRRRMKPIRRFIFGNGRGRSGKRRKGHRPNSDVRVVHMRTDRRKEQAKKIKQIQVVKEQKSKQDGTAANTTLRVLGKEKKDKSPAATVQALESVVRQLSVEDVEKLPAIDERSVVSTITD